MKKYCYDSKRYPAYLDQLGVRYPVLPDSGGPCAVTPG
jgi:hypothetical protein